MRKPGENLGAEGAIFLEAPDFTLAGSMNFKPRLGAWVLRTKVLTAS